MNEPEESTDVTRVEVDGKTIFLIGTAHISAQSVEVVNTTIAAEQPDTVCVELDAERFKALSEQTNWQDLDLKQIIRNGQTTFLVARLALMAFQKRMSMYTGVKPGMEMLAATNAAKACGAMSSRVLPWASSWRNSAVLACNCSSDSARKESSRALVLPTILE